MTPFGAHLRVLRAERGISQKDMAEALGVTATYLSALERGRRGRPTFDLVNRMIGYLNIIWDEADELHRLAALSDPKVTIDTSECDPDAVLTANVLARRINRLDQQQLERILTILDEVKAR